MSRKAVNISGEPRIWSSVIRGLMLPMEEMNLPPEDLLSRCNIPLSAVEKSQEAIPLKKYLQFWNLAAEEAGDPLIGIHLARSAGPETLGALGFLFMASHTLMDALSNLCAYVNLVQDATHVQLIQNAKEITFCYDLAPIADIDNRHDVEFSLALMCRLTQMYTGSQYKPLRLQFRHAPPIGGKSEYARLLRIPVFFQEESNAIVLSAAAGQFRGHISDDNLAAILKELLDEQLRRHTPEKSLSEQVYDLLYPGQMEGSANARSIAAHFGVSEATLHRRLRAEGTQLSEIVSRRQFEMAKEYLSSSWLEMTQIAHIVGFSEAASFTRAFKRWSGGVTPSGFRKSIGEKLDRNNSGLKAYVRTNEIRGE